MPYQRLPKPGDPVATTRTHTVAIAYDGTDAEAPARRQAARGAHIARMQPMAADGTLAIGGAILDEAESRMIGSITVTRHATDEAARAWMAEDPYMTGGVWQDIALHATRLAALPYRPNVGIMLINPQGLIFAAQRLDSEVPAWQMPQGGIDAGEDPRAGRWRGKDKDECGIHVVDGRVIRRQAS